MSDVASAVCRLCHRPARARNLPDAHRVDDGTKLWAACRTACRAACCRTACRAACRAARCRGTGDGRGGGLACPCVRPRSAWVRAIIFGRGRCVHQRARAAPTTTLALFRAWHAFFSICSCCFVSPYHSKASEHCGCTARGGREELRHVVVPAQTGDVQRRREPRL
jgi:hypothetical protein